MYKELRLETKIYPYFIQSYLETIGGQTHKITKVYMCLMF